MLSQQAAAVIKGAAGGRSGTLIALCHEFTPVAWIWRHRGGGGVWRRSVHGYLGLLAPGGLGVFGHPSGSGR